MQLTTSTYSYEIAQITMSLDKVVGPILMDGAHSSTVTSQQRSVFHSDLGLLTTTHQCSAQCHSQGTQADHGSGHNTGMRQGSLR